MSQPISLRLAVSHPPQNAGHLATTFVVDGALAIDAGAIASRLSLEEQGAVRHVLLTHAHLDHISQLPQFLDNVQTRDPGASPRPLTVHAERTTLEIVGRHLFGGVWPDVVDPSIGFASLEPFDLADGRATIRVANFEVLAVRTVHRMPTVGYVLRRDDRSLAILADTGYQKGLLEGIDTTGLKLLALECSYPNRLDAWAEDHGHLTPNLLGDLAQPLVERAGGVRVIVHHLKPVFADEITAELEDVRHRGIELEIAADGRVIEL